MSTRSKWDGCWRWILQLVDQVCTGDRDGEHRVGEADGCLVGFHGGGSYTVRHSHHLVAYGLDGDEIQPSAMTCT